MLYKKLDWSERSSFLIVDQIIFINAHLSSKADPNGKQIEELKEGLRELKEKMPKYEIVVAGDLNSFLPPFSDQFSLFPEDADQMTTVKKRTFTQGQFNKADKVVR